MIELPVVEGDEALTARVILPDPLREAVLDFLLPVAGGLRGRHVYRGLSLRVLVEDRRGAQIGCILDERVARDARRAPFVAVGEPGLDGLVDLDGPPTNLRGGMPGH